MTRPAPRSTQPQPLSPTVFHVLLAIGRETLHGFAIMQRFETLTKGEERLLPGTLYATLARMTEDGHLEEVAPPRGERSGGPPRRHYRVTERGRAAAAQETERLQRLIELARRQAILPDAGR